MIIERSELNAAGAEGIEPPSKVLSQNYVANLSSCSYLKSFQYYSYTT